MKQFFLLLLFISTFSKLNALEVNDLLKNQTTKSDTILPYLLSIDLNHFIGKPVDSILNALPSSYVRRDIIGWDNFRYAQMLAVRYPDSSLVLIIVKNFTHLNPYSQTMMWDLNLFKQETVFCIEIYKTGMGLLRPTIECDPYK